MTQELIDLRNSILEKRYADALAIVDELEGMSKKAILRQIKSFLKILIIHLIKNQIEKRLTNSWAASIRNGVLEIQDVNLKENKKSYYIDIDEWNDYIEHEIDVAIRDASVEVLNGIYSPFQLAEIVDKEQIINQAKVLLELTYGYLINDLPGIVDDYLTKLPGGEDWKLGRR
ncbi:DUF29 family protein [Cylindrospermum sp. FACHB-282]|uniref:DUF29 family protein n=1 Tax=Cylindrospermum sp. FACHB-282 TaxID=2692794 RepID=UPI0016874DE5|nr:DUF29 family protein [Cylindrospermum sp. FACHB-282]MBD2386985.1 DUF29 family protein [Cylindrospermum sp. FACHB-282]